MTDYKTAGAAIYCRISRDFEGKKYGVERQEADCRELAQRLGIEAVEVYVDNDIGASSETKKHRPEYDRLLHDIRKGRIKTLLAYSNSRLTRRPREWIDLIDLAKPVSKGGCELQIRTVVSGDHDLTTADGRAVAITIAAWDAAEAERIAERSRRAYADRAQRGEPSTSGKRAFGWKKDRVNLNKREAELIKLGIQMLINGHKLVAITEHWNSKGVPTVRGLPWGSNSVRKVLASPRLAGIRTLNYQPVLDANGQPVRGWWQPIITDEEHRLVQAILNKRKTRRAPRSNYLLAGSLICGRCRAPMYGRNTETPVYVCRDGHVGIHMARLDDHVMTQIGLRLIKIYDYTKRNPPEHQPADEAFPGDEQLRELALDIEAMMNDYYESPRTRQHILTQVDETLRPQLEELQREKALWKEERKPLPRMEVPDNVIFDMPSFNYLVYGMDKDHPSGTGEALWVDLAVKEIMVKGTQQGRRQVAERVEVVFARGFTPWPVDEEPPLPDHAQRWLDDYLASLPPDRYRPEVKGAKSELLAETVDLLRESPGLTARELATRLGVSEGSATSVRLYARRQLERDPNFEAPESPKQRSSRFFQTIAEAMKDNPEVTGKELREQLGLSSGYVSIIMNKVRATLADDPDYDFSKGHPSTQNNRKGSKRLPTVIRHLEESPSLTGTQLAELLGVSDNYAKQLLAAAREVVAANSA